MLLNAAICQRVILCSFFVFQTTYDGKGSSENSLPRQVEHGFGKKYDEQHMGKHDGVDVFGPADGQGASCHFDDGDGEMDEDADCQQDFEGEERTE